MNIFFLFLSFGFFLSVQLLSQNTENTNPEEFHYPPSITNSGSLAPPTKKVGHTDFDAITSTVGDTAKGFNLSGYMGNFVKILLIDFPRPNISLDAFKKNGTTTSRISLPYSVDSKHTDDHATHVSGVISGSDATRNINGIAPKAEIIFLDWCSPWILGENNLMDRIKPYAQNGVKIACLPFGIETGWYKKGNDYYWYGSSDYKEYYFGTYTIESRDLDSIAQCNPYLLMINSSGNNLGQGPVAKTDSFFMWRMNQSVEIDWYKTIDVILQPNINGFENKSTLNPLAVARNLLTIGAVNVENDLKLDHSSTGPTNDFRIKPDLVAYGQNIRTVSKSGNEISVSGTSFSAAAVSAGVALLTEELETKNQPDLLASTLKALLINTADYIVDRPTKEYGWGKINFPEALKLLVNNITTADNIYEVALNSAQEEIILYVEKKQGMEMKVTICWSDEVYYGEGNLPGSTNRVLRNDIDLIVDNYTDTSIHYLPWSLNKAAPFTAVKNRRNDVDNVEQLEIAASEGGIYTIRINAKTGGLHSKQLVSLIVSGIKTGNEKTLAINKPALLNQTFCSGGTFNSIVLSPPAGSIFRWFEVSSFGNQIPTSTVLPEGTKIYYAESYNTTKQTIYAKRKAVTVEVKHTPILFNVTGSSTYCSNNVGLDGSELYVTYTLSKYGYSFGTKTGTGSAIDFGLQTSDNTYAYTVIATSSSGCTSTMNGSALISGTAIPSAPSASSGQTFCSGTAINGISVARPSGSVVRLYTVATSGSPLGNTMVMPTGTITYYAESYNATTGCVSASRKAVSVIVNPSPAVFNVTGSGTFCSGPVGLSGSELGVTYNLWMYNSIYGTFTGTGSAKSFGNMASSPYEYTVIATGSNGCTSSMNGFAKLNPGSLPNPITGLTSVSIGASINLYETTTGGTWKSSAVNIATVNPTTGLVTGVSAGNADISYTISATGCSTKVTVTVTALKSAFAQANEDDRFGEPVSDSYLKGSYPNPTTGLTTLSYYLAEDATNARIVIYNIYNGITKQYMLNDKGNAKLDIDLRDLPSGIYFYRLQINGSETGMNKLILNK